jgi:hypothetical protein
LVVVENHAVSGCPYCPGNQDEGNHEELRVLLNFDGFTALGDGV